MNNINELEDMRQQINELKQRIDRESKLNEQLLHRFLQVGHFLYPHLDICFMFTTANVCRFSGCCSMDNHRQGMEFFSIFHCIHLFDDACLRNSRVFD